jgi:hypothetical protein
VWCALVREVSWWGCAELLWLRLRSEVARAWGEVLQYAGAPVARGVGEAWLGLSTLEEEELPVWRWWCREGTEEGVMLCVPVGAPGCGVVITVVSGSIARGGGRVVGLVALSARSCWGLYGRRWDVGAAARGASHPSSDIGELLRSPAYLVR